MIREGAAELGLVPMKTITPDDAATGTRQRAHRGWCTRPADPWSADRANRGAHDIAAEIIRRARRRWRRLRCPPEQTADFARTAAADGGPTGTPADRDHAAQVHVRRMDAAIRPTETRLVIRLMFFVMCGRRKRLLKTSRWLQQLLG